MGENKEDAAFGAGLLVGGLVVMVIALVLVYGLNHGYLISTPIGGLEVGKIYEVKAILRDGGYCYLLLETDNGIRYYRLTAEIIPPDLEPGDGLVQYLDGEPERLPHRFG